MAVPKFMARINRWLFNPIEVKRGVRPVLTHVGRSSGRSYQTPLDAHPVDGGFVFFPIYGPDSDWVQNILASGSAVLTIDGDRIELISPRLVTEAQIREELPSDVKLPSGFLKISNFLRMDRSA